MDKDELLKRLQEIRERGMMQREATVVAVDAEARTVELSFSSEAEYKRWFGVEVLSHDAGAVRLGRLNDKAAVLWNHNWDDQRGVVESARIDGDRKGRALVRFSKSEAGDQLLQDIADEIITKVSVGYLVHGIRWQETRDDETDVYVVTDWEPYEISMVSVPADPSVGVGRSAEIPQEETRASTVDNGTIDNNPAAVNPTKRETMNIKNLYDSNGNFVRAEVNEAGEITKILEVLQKAGDSERAQTQRGVDAERNRVRAITDMGTQYDQRDLAMDFVGSGKSPEDFQRALLDKMNERNGKPMQDTPVKADIGMSDREVRNFSLFRAVRALLPNASKADREAAAFEFECSRTAEKAYGKEAKGILIPQDVLDRGFNAGGAANTPTGATSGSNLVANELLAGSFIEMLRNKTTIMRLARVMGGLVGNVDVPKQTAGATAYWLGEGADATEGTPVIGQIALNPKTVAAYTDVTRRLLMQSTPDAEGIVRGDLISAVSQALDFAGYYGTGADNQPRGIKNYTGINAVDFAAVQPTYAELVAMESAIAADNADVDSMAYVLNAVGRGALKTTQKFTGTNGSPVWEPGNTVNGYRAEVTNQLVTGDTFFGNYADMIVGLWGGLDLTVDPYSLSKSGGTRIVVFQDVDFVLRRLESFCYGSATVTP